ncbi:MAG: type IX secretion system sortase PorU [Bacteroidales bacterium]|nr:type IX secretion system sortase PorU [Bacteroidales bacterium]
MLKKVILLSILIVLSVVRFTQAQDYDRHLQWKAIDPAILTFSQNASGLYFEDCIIDEENGLPLFASRFTVSGNFKHYEAIISNAVFEPLTAEEVSAIPSFFEPGPEVALLKQEISYIRKEPHVYVTLLPFRRNAITGNIEKLVSFHLEFLGSGIREMKSTHEYASQSVLATGDWLKISTTEKGIHKITFQELTAAGFNLQDIHPDRIRLYGNGGAMLNEQNDLPRTDDLREVAIEFVSANSEVFATDDFLLFYAPSPHRWRPLTTGGSLRFEFSKNAYADTSYYFITIAEPQGKRIQNLQSLTQPATHQVTTFHDYGIYKPDAVNLAKVGRQWFGDKITGGSDPLQLPSFSFPYIDSTYRVLVRGRFAVKATEMSRVRIHVNDNGFLGSLVAVPSAHVYANIAPITATFYTSNPDFNVSVEYVNSNSSASAWIDFVELNLRRRLVYTGGQFSFRDLTAIGEFYVSNFRLENPAEDIQIWEVTDVGEPARIEHTITEDTLEFRLSTEVLREFLAFRTEDALRVHGLQAIQNQNLHAVESHDLIIVSPLEFLPEAEHYAQLRRSGSNISVKVVPIEQIFNEFASGSPDPTAIRDFMKMLYDREIGGNEPSYLLLFGDGSYDPKNRLSNNMNFIPTYQSDESLRLDATYVTDDYYGLLDDGEGLGAAGSLDIGIGRFPINSIEQAAILHNKVEYYLLNKEKTHMPWRNSVSLIAHDEDNDVHLDQAEQLASYLDTTHTVFSLDKIYLDAYQRVYVPSGYRYPDVSLAINERVSEGALLINYIGHGGETGWAHSKVLTISDINAWQNLDNMPVFLTATCSFGRFDNPELVSAGEMVVLNADGGGIALFTTSRLAYSSYNFKLNKSFTRFFFDRTNGNISSLGEILMKAKNDNANNLYIRNFVLLGDPSLKPAIPANNVITTSVNGVQIEESTAVLGMSEVTISGHVADNQMNKMTGFNGLLYPVVYDKSMQYYTNANHSSSTPKPFSLQNSVLYKGKVSIVNGDFSFSFVVPRDVNPLMGNGKISYYATNGQTDANGYLDEFEIGGLDPQANDDVGPLIEMYMNTTDFSSGDPTGANPLLLANLSDESGINYFELGIGHEIVAFLNEDTQNPILLDRYFEPDMDTYKSGSIQYRFLNLPDGRHTLRLKAFDLNNNSSEATIEFVVNTSMELATGDMDNYPNPFSSGTWFRFKHNYYDQIVNVAIDIVDITGQQVKSIGPLNVPSSNSAITPIYWDGTSENGRFLTSGVYIYTVKTQTLNGKSSTMQGKLMIVR